MAQRMPVLAVILVSYFMIVLDLQHPLRRAACELASWVPD